ncbi:MAG: TIGR00159 family protein [Myxococcales bacterium]|nr:TIGR00159 family protein [Myxococcales bacterium]
MTGFIVSFLRELTLWQGITAAVDILVVAYVIYRVLVLVKGTRAAQMLIGLVLVAAGFFVAKLFELTTLSWLLDNLINYSIIFFIVIFQHDIRRGLVRVGQNLFASSRQYEETFVFEEVIKAAEALARSRIGALIVLERDADLQEFLGDPGVVLDARVTKESIIASFLPEPENNLHDGAMLIKNLRIERAGCVLPLSANPKLDKALGTRHRAAIGITEETDAVVVVVSEERGTVSLCFGGNIARDLDAATLRKALLGLFHKEKGKRARPPGPAPKARRSDPSEPTQSIVARVIGEERTDREPAAQADPEPVPVDPADPAKTAKILDFEAKG